MKRFASLSLLLLSVLTHLMPAHADTYPNKPVTLMVPYPPGGLSDVIARKVNQALAQELKQPVIIDGRNLYNPARLEDDGWRYHSVGRSQH